MLFSNFPELAIKGIAGKIFYWIRIALCALPIASFITCIYWAIITASKNWSTIVNNSILILCIFTAILSLASFIFILFATLSILRKVEKLLTYLYFFITIVAFIVGFVLISFGSSSNEIDYLSKFDKACGDTYDVELKFPTPTIPPPTATPFPTSTPVPSTPFPTTTPAPTEPPNTGNNLLLESESLSDNFTSEQPDNFSNSAFCQKYWTSWSRKKYIRIRTTEAKNIFAGILSPWIIIFFIELVLLLILEHHQPQKNSGDLPNEDNALLDSNLINRPENNGDEDDNQQLGSHPIFRDPDGPTEGNNQA